MTSESGKALKIENRKLKIENLHFHRLARSIVNLQFSFFNLQFSIPFGLHGVNLCAAASGPHLLNIAERFQTLTNFCLFAGVVD